MPKKATFGVVLPDYCGGNWQGEYMSGDELINFCREVEKLGYTAIWHVERYMVVPSLIPTSWYEPLITIASISAFVKKTRIGSVILLPLRNPGLLAKEIATLDVISSGRFMLGAAIGWLDKEFDLVGVNIGERGKRFEEAIKVMKLLWTSEAASWEGRFWKFKEIRLEPKPLQKPHPPIMIGAGGRSINDPRRFEQLLKRAVELGDGWYAAAHISAEYIRKATEILGKYLQESKRDDQDFQRIINKYIYIIDGDEGRARKAVAQVLNMSLEDAKKQPYLICEKNELARRVDEYISAGITHLNLLPVTREFNALEYVANEIMPCYD
mgnify:CR=1 FL=1